MTYLLAISIGPVQEFIAAGKRTNDLYAGSDLIVAISMAAAAAIESREPGSLIFPADAEQRATNKILAEVAGDPKKATEAAEKAARDKLSEEWQQALGRMGPQRNHIDDHLADQQVNSFLEFYAAWWPRSGDYKTDRRHVERLLAGRKALRDFKQAPKSNRPKSPLDPSRDTVIKSDEMPESCRKPPLRLKPSEWLDAVSLLKRATRLERVPATGDVAARTLEARLAADGPEDTAALQILHRISRPDFVGDLVFAERRKDLREERDPGDVAILDRLESEFQSRGLPIPEADPYFAILRADGDKMGDLISKIGESQEHKEFSRKLATFANRAESTVENHKGYLVYSGGDDVLAFLPVHTALACAGGLAEQFKNDINGATLSVGVAVVHYHEPLYVSLGQARAAEKAAKDAGRNRLAMTFHTRGGQARAAVWKWEDGYGYSDWKLWIDAFSNRLSHGFPYELEALAREFDGAELDGDLLYLEACRIWCRKEGAPTREVKGKKVPVEWADDELRRAASSPKALAELAQRLILFRALARYPM